jgi:uracil-DNA glycosylase
MSTIDLKEIQQKLYERLKPSGWADRLKGYLLSDDFHRVLLTLYGELNEGHRFTPVLKQIFRAFEECPFDELKVVMITPEPHPKAGAADGISFSCSNTGVIQGSLKYMFEELERTIDPEYVQNPDLKRWSNQGILMLNTALTTRAGTPGKHAELWNPFMVYLFDVLKDAHTGIIFVHVGQDAKPWSSSLHILPVLPIRKQTGTVVIYSIQLIRYLKSITILKSYGR